MLDVKDEFHRILVDAKVRGIARDVADYMVSHAFATIPQIAESFGKPYQSINNAAEALIEQGIVDDVPGGSQRIIRATKVLAAYRR